jgi:addiction module RelB/DinJ family antitoxin
MKTAADNLFNSLGLDTSTAVRMFLSASINSDGLPFAVKREKKPNARLLAAMEETEQIIKEYENGTRKPQPYTSVRDFLQEIIDEEDDDFV